MKTAARRLGTVLVGLLSWTWTEIRTWQFRRCAFRLDRFMAGGPLRLDMAEWKQFEAAQEGVRGLVSEMSAMGLQGLKERAMIRRATRKHIMKIKPNVPLGVRIECLWTGLRAKASSWWRNVLEEGEQWRRGKQWDQPNVQEE
ncbi:MAG: hypothetical protein HYT87_12960 [Nitrospirae bacterium]|nr:hypothetical protein [Nitrospirota bacterium]